MWLLWIILILIVLKLYLKVTSGWCHSRTIMTGKVAVVTGANSGIGFETAFNLARRGAKVYLACRNEQKGKHAVQDILSRVKGNTSVFYRHLDLCSLKSVRSFVEEIKKSEVKLDVLVNNAGVFGPANEKTEDGFVKEAQTNIFGPFLLTNLLIPLLKNSEYARVITVSSFAHCVGKADLNRINQPLPSPSRWKMFKFYANTNLCNVLFSNELARRLKDTNITSNSLHPGVSYTSLNKNLDGFTRRIVDFLESMLFKSAIEGAQTSIYCAVSEDVSEVTGCYFVDCKEANTAAAAKEEAVARSLWEYSEKLVGLKPGERIE